MFAAVVPSTPQAGHCTGVGIRPLTGSTSNLYRVPQPHSILISIFVERIVSRFNHHRYREATNFLMFKLSVNVPVPASVLHLRETLQTQSPCCPSDELSFFETLCPLSSVSFQPME